MGLPKFCRESAKNQHLAEQYGLSILNGSITYNCEYIITVPAFSPYFLVIFSLSVFQNGNIRYLFVHFRMLKKKATSFLLIAFLIDWKITSSRLL